jgi:hypothetical protein
LQLLNLNSHSLRCKLNIFLFIPLNFTKSNFGITPGKRSRGTLGKTIVLGLLKRGDKVYTEIVSDCSAARLQSIIRGKASIPYLLVLANPTQWFFLGCHGCVYRGHAVHQSKIHQLQSTDNAHINGIESFWGYAKIRFSKI